MADSKSKEAVTIQTIAKLANVSHTTVSRALNGSSSVKPETRRKIERIAKEAGYVPNFNARRLVTHRSYNIGVFFSNLNGGTSASFLSTTIETMEKLLSASYTFSVGSIEKEHAADKLSKQNYDGILVMSQSDADDEFIERARQQKIPTVVLNRFVDNPEIDNFAIDEKLGLRLATEYAIRMGHREFALIEGVEKFASTQLRTAGFKEALKTYSIDPDSVIYKHDGDYRPAGGNVEMRQILSSGKVPTCVICENDDMAIGAINACSEFGYRVPDDISVIGFDDMPYSQYLTPELTTVRKPTETMIQKGIKRLLEIIEKPAVVEPVRRIIDPEIIVRSSVRKLN